MKKAILLLLCCGLVMCSACNKAEPPSTENPVLTVSQTKTTESKIGSSSTVDESITTEKENSTPSESEYVETSSDFIIKDEPQETVKIHKRSEPSQETYSTPKEEIVGQVIADSAEVEQLVVKYINEFRVAQGDMTATVIPGLTDVARYRTNQLINNFAHVDIREACGELKYGRYFDMTEYGIDAKYNYYEEYDREAICKQIRFHDLRHTFATRSLENGMDVKTLSSIIGHVSAATTLDIYSHMTDTMQIQAAINIDRKIGGTDAEMPEVEQTPEPNIKTQPAPDFKPLERKIRKSGTGCVYQINDTLWEGSYYPRLPNGKRKKFNVYAKTKEECEKLLAEMIKEKKAEIKAEKLN